MQIASIGSELEEEAFGLRSLEIANQILEHMPMGLARVCHELAEFVDGESNIWASPTREEICQRDQTAVLGCTV